MSDQNIAANCAVRLALRYPFWTEIYYSMSVKESTALPTAATDGRSLWLNPTFWHGLVLDEQVKVMVHELLHKILLHNTRRGARHGMLWNIAADYAVNYVMITNGWKLDSTWLVDRQYDEWTVEAIYADLLKRRRKAEDQGNPNPFVISDAQMDLKEPEIAMTTEEVEKFEEEVKSLTERAIANAKAYGKLPAGIEKGVVEAYKPKREAWFNHLHRYMQALTTSEYNWAKLNRRSLKSHGVFTPMHQSEALGPVELFIDTSGSVYDNLSQSNFAGHVNAILGECRPQSLRVSYFDTRVYEGELIEPGELEFTSKPKGGGGTAFEPIFEDLEERGAVPAVVIIMTDLMGSFPKEAPHGNVVWATIYDTDAPFGETIYMGDE